MRLRKKEINMETTFENLEPNDLFANEYGQIMVKGYGVWFHTGKIVYCAEGDIGRYYVEADAPVTKINLPDETKLNELNLPDDSTGE